ncbi:MAG: hypothetical protein AAF721_02610 [Myxococcota bacterium]
MTQFIVVATDQLGPPEDGMRLRSASAGAAWLDASVRTYFVATAALSFLVDERGGAESLLDELWEAQRHGGGIEGTRLGRVLARFVERDVAFVLWCGADTSDLPTFRTWDTIATSLREQTAEQPAEVWLRFEPAPHSTNDPDHDAGLGPSSADDA